MTPLGVRSARTGPDVGAAGRRGRVVVVGASVVVVVTGALGCICWLSMSLLHEVVGDSIKRTGSYSQGMALAGLFPLLGLAVLTLFWGRDRAGSEATTAGEATEAASNGNAETALVREANSHIVNSAAPSPEVSALEKLP